MTLGSLSHSKGSVSHVQNSLYRGDEDLKSKRAGSYQLHKAHTDHLLNLPSLTSFAFGSIFFSLLNSCPTSPAHPSPFPWSGGEGQIAVSAEGWVAASWHSCAVLPCPPGDCTFRGTAPNSALRASPSSLPAAAEQCLCTLVIPPKAAAFNNVACSEEETLVSEPKYTESTCWSGSH